MNLSLNTYTYQRAFNMVPRGGARPNAGRPKGYEQYNEPTKPIRIPVSKVHDIQRYLEDCAQQRIPLFSCKVSAGFPSPADDYIESHIDLNTLLVPHPSATFIVRVSGDSMINAGISDGDLLIVDRSIEPTHGRIVIAAVNGELTVKRLSLKEGCVVLMPENNQYKPLYLHDELDLVIWGVVIHNIKSVF